MPLWQPAPTRVSLLHQQPERTRVSLGPPAHAEASQTSQPLQQPPRISVLRKVHAPRAVPLRPVSSAATSHPRPRDTRRTPLQPMQPNDTRFSVK